MRTNNASLLLLLFIVGTCVGNFCTGTESEGTLCTMRILDSRPTQYSVGYLAALCKQEKFEKMSEKDLEKYLTKEDHFIPIVTGPDTNLFMVDHHHMLDALFMANLKAPLMQRTVIAKVIKNWYLNNFFSHYFFRSSQFNGTKEGYYAFWKTMEHVNLSWPYDNHGKWCDVALVPMPTQVNGTTNDPYRTLAYALRQYGAFGKNDAPFVEFAWANFMRTRIALPYTSSVMEERDALRAIFHDAMRIAKSDEARHLPGWGQGKEEGVDCALLKLKEKKH